MTITASKLRAAVLGRIRQLTGVGLVGLDQLVLSGLSFAVSLVLIAWGTKSEFGFYTLINSGLLLGLGLQNAVIVTPLIVNGIQFSDADRAAFRKQLAGLQIGLSGLLGVAGGIAAAAASHQTGRLRFVVGASVLASVCGGWAREFRRGELLLERRYSSLLLGDSVYAATALSLLLGYSFINREIHAWVPLLCVGLAGVITGTRALDPGALLYGTRHLRWPLPWRRYVGQIRWTVPGMLVSWVQGAAYPYVIAITAGSEAVAEVAAARLFVSPGLLLNGAYGRYLLSHLGAANNLGGVSAVRREARGQSRWSVSTAALYAAFLALFLSAGGVSMLPEQYRGITPGIFIWALVLVGVSFRTVPGIALQSLAEFRILLLLGAAAMAVACCAMLTLGLAFGGAGCIVGLAAGEASLGVMLWRRLLRHVPRCGPASGAGNQPPGDRRFSGGTERGPEM